MIETLSLPRRTFLDMSSYQWTVIFAGCLGWGFNVFDWMLFNFVASNCVPSLLNLPLGSPEAKSATLLWTGLVSSIVLIGVAAGGVLFGKVTDRIGRKRTLVLTILIYSIATAAGALAPNIWTLIISRAIASLGIGGEWAAGASMVAEVVPDHRRVEAGALLQMASPIGLFLATFVTYQVTAAFANEPTVSWRYVFLFGLIPTSVAFFIRFFIREPDRWKNLEHKHATRIRELFRPPYLWLTISGLSVTVIALITWWSCNAFVSVVAKGLAQQEALQIGGLDAAAVELMGQQWIRTATNSFNLGSLIGAAMTIPTAKLLGRRKMFLTYFSFAAISIAAAFGTDLDPHTRLYMYLPIGLATSGIFGCFVFYLPELFPTRVRGTGAGFTFNSGRVIAAVGPLLVGIVAASGADAHETAMKILVWVAIVPLIGILLLPLVIETKDRLLPD